MRPFRQWGKAAVRARLLEGFEERQREREQRRKPLKDYCREYSANLRAKAKQERTQQLPDILLAVAHSRRPRVFPYRPTAPRRGTRHEGTGPTTHEGWYALFVNTGIRSYLKAHPDLAATLKSSNTPPADYGSHLPEADFNAIKDLARQRAQAKCPASTPAEVSSK